MNLRREPRDTLSRPLPSSPIFNHVSITFLTALLLSGCAYQAPTAPSVVPTVAEVTPAPNRIARVELTPTVQPGGRAVALALRVWNETGQSTPAVAASCAASSGAVYPARITGIGTALAEWTNPAPTPGTVTCTVEGYATPATAAVDLSAWSVRLQDPREALDDAARWRTYVRAIFDPIGTSYPARLRTVSWGDGNVETLPGSMLTGAGTQALTHLYARSGSYDVRVRVEWDGGAAEARYTLTRTCGPAPTFPGAADAYGLCWVDLRELR